MKARIRKTGEIVEVYHETQHGTSKMIYKESVLVNSRMWTEDELEPLTNNEKDERLRKTSISFLKHYADKGYENAVECIDWLESIKERINNKKKGGEK